jgi:hypothetical protein
MARLPHIISVLFITLAFQVNSQDKQSHSVSYHSVIGLNISNLTGSDVSDAGSRVSFNLGFGVDIQFNDQWSFAPEIVYSRQGFKSDIVASDIGSADPFFNTLEERVTFSQDYLLVPLKMHFRPIEAFYVFAGPQVAILLNESNNSRNVSEVDIINRSAPIYFAGTIGAGARLYKGLGLRVSYQFGLSRAFKDLEITDFLFGNENIKTKAYHSVFNVSLIYSFNF